MSCHPLRTTAFSLMAIAAALSSAPAATYYVDSITALTTRINSAVPGDQIVVSNGVYTTSASLGISRPGTSASPILIRAETVGGAEITGSHGFSFNSGAAYVTVQGFKFTHAASINLTSGANHCRLTRNLIELTIPAGSDVSYVNISGDDMEIDRNELRNKSTLGNMLDVTGSGSQVARRLWVHHNYFHDFTSPGGNGAETIRLGLSGLSLSTGNALVEFNLFVRCTGENEMISNKSSGNTYRYNTVLDCVGGEISQRHGNDCLYYGNYLRNTAGMRVFGDRHRIFSNYLESNSIGVNMGNGDGDVYNGDALTSHDRPDDNVVVYNTFINNSTHYQMGGRTGGLGSSNTVVANNIFQGGGSMASISSSAPYTGAWSNNIRWQTSSAGNMPASGYTNVNPLLLKDSSGAFHIQPGSPAINAGVGSSDYYGVHSSYPYVLTDMDGQPRDSQKDIGADELSGAPVIAHILSTSEVGPNSSTNGPRASANLRWYSTGGTSWDVGISPNWLNLSNSAVDVFLEGDSVLFDDSSPSASATNIALAEAVLPAAITNDSSARHFTISGPGRISGSTVLVKKGTSTLRLSATNDFTGSVLVQAGTLKTGTGSALGLTNGATIVQTGATLDVNGQNLGTEPITVSGAGADGAGAIVNNATAAATTALKFVTLADHTTFGGTQRWDIRGSPAALLTGGHAYALTKLGPNQVSIVATVVDPALGDVDIQEGTLAIQTSTLSLSGGFGNPTNLIVVHTNATLGFWNLTGTGTNTLPRRILCHPGATLLSEDGATTLSGAVTLQGDLTIQVINGGGSANDSLTLTGTISGPGGLIKRGAFPLFLSGSNAYVGSTLVSEGALVLTNSGNIAGTSNLTIAAGAALDTTGRDDGRFALLSGQTLGGNGAISGSLLVVAAAIVSPGLRRQNGADPLASLGALTVAGTATLQGTTSIELNQVAATNDVLISSTSINYGGTLELTNSAGSLATGNTFHIFSAPAYSGVFAKLTPAIPALNLAWNTNTLAADGTLRIVSLPTPQPLISSVSLNQNNLVLACSNGVPGWTACLLSSTNLATPVSGWAIVVTNALDAQGNGAFSAPLVPGEEQRFYLIELL